MRVGFAGFSSIRVAYFLMDAYKFYDYEFSVHSLHKNIFQLTIRLYEKLCSGVYLNEKKWIGGEDDNALEWASP